MSLNETQINERREIVIKINQRLRDIEVLKIDLRRLQELCAIYGHDNLGCTHVCKYCGFDSE